MLATASQAQASTRGGPAPCEGVSCGSTPLVLPVGRRAPPQPVAHLHRNVLPESRQLGGGRLAKRVGGRVGGW